MKNIVKKSVIIISLMSAFAYAMIPDTVNDYETKINIHSINKNK